MGDKYSRLSPQLRTYVGNSDFSLEFFDTVISSPSLIPYREPKDLVMTFFGENKAGFAYLMGHTKADYRHGFKGFSESENYSIMKPKVEDLLPKFDQNPDSLICFALIPSRKELRIAKTICQEKGIQLAGYKGPWLRERLRRKTEKGSDGNYYPAIYRPKRDIFIKPREKEVAVDPSTNVGTLYVFGMDPFSCRKFYSSEEEKQKKREKIAILQASTVLDDFFDTGKLDLSESKELMEELRFRDEKNSS